MYLEIEICIYCPARRPVAFSERVVLQEQSGAAIAAAASAGPWPALSAQQVPVPGRGTRGRGLCRSPRFWRKVLICRATPPPTSSALPSPGVSEGMVSSTGSAAPVLSDWFFCLIKDKVKEGGRLAKLGCCSALPLDAVYNCYFRGGGGTGGENLFVSVQTGPLLSMSTRESHL